MQFAELRREVRITFGALLGAHPSPKIAELAIGRGLDGLPLRMWYSSLGIQKVTGRASKALRRLADISLNLERIQLNKAQIFAIFYENETIILQVVRSKIS